MRRILTLTLFLTTSVMVIAQNKGHITISAGYGPISNGSALGDFTFGPDKSYQQNIANRFSPVYAGTIRYFITRKIDLGLTFAYKHQDGTRERNDGNNLTTIGSFKRQRFTLAAEVCVTYGKAYSKWYRIYTCAGIGYRYTHEVDRYDDSYYYQQYTNGIPDGSRQWYVHKAQPNVYYAPLGVRAGGRISGYIEVGFGYKGVINGGLILTL